MKILSRLRYNGAIECTLREKSYPVKCVVTEIISITQSPSNVYIHIYIHTHTHIANPAAYVKQQA